MRICLISPEFLNCWGGVGSYSFDLVQNLPSRIEVHVVTLEANGRGNTEMEEYGHRLPRNVILHTIGTKSETFFYNPRFQYAVGKTVPKLHNDFDFDIVHSNHAHMSDILLKIKNFKVSSITTMHTTLTTQRNGTKSSEVPMKSLERSEKCTFLLFPLLRTLERIYFSKTDNAICVSDFVRNNLSEEYGVLPKNCETIHNGVDIDLFSSSRERTAPEFFPKIAEWDGPKILFCGRLIALKGVYVLIQSMREVLSEFPDALFIFAGDGNKLPLVLKLSELGIPKRNFVFLGQVDRLHMPYLYSLSQAYVLPSFSESCPMGVLEAMATETPVVASNVGGIPELVEDGVTGTLIDPGDSETLAGAIISILRDPERASLLADRALKTVKLRFHIEKQVKETLNMYEKALDDGI